MMRRRLPLSLLNRCLRKKMDDDDLPLDFSKVYFNESTETMVRTLKWISKQEALKYWPGKHDKEID